MDIEADELAYYQRYCNILWLSSAPSMLSYFQCYLCVICKQVIFTPRPGLLPTMQAVILHSWCFRVWRMKSRVCFEKIFTEVLNKCECLKKFLLNKTRKLLPEIYWLIKGLYYFMSDNLIFFILVKERLDISNVQRILSFLILSLSHYWLNWT